MEEPDSPEYELDLEFPKDLTDDIKLGVGVGI